LRFVIFSNETLYSRISRVVKIPSKPIITNNEDKFLNILLIDRFIVHSLKDVIISLVFYIDSL